MAERLTAEERREREDKVLKLWHRGSTYGEIAKQLGFANRSGAKKALERARERHGRPDMDRESAREKDVERLDVLLKTYWPKAKAGNLDASREVRQILRQRAHLLGLMISPQSLLSGLEESSDDDQPRKDNVVPPSVLDDLRKEVAGVRRRGAGA